MGRLLRRILWCAALLQLSGCGTSAPRFASTADRHTHSSDNTRFQLEGIASYYAEEFNGRRTANGETYDMHALTAAHRTLPFNSKVRVVNRTNGRSVVVRVNDRGPFKDNRVIDLSLGAAMQLELVAHGTAPVSIEIIELGSSGD